MEPGVRNCWSKVASGLSDAGKGAPTQMALVWTITRQEPTRLIAAAFVIMQSRRLPVGEHIVAMRPKGHSLSQGPRHAGPQALIRRPAAVSSFSVAHPSRHLCCSRSTLSKERFLRLFLPPFTGGFMVLSDIGVSSYCDSMTTMCCATRECYTNACSMYVCH